MVTTNLADCMKHIPYIVVATLLMAAASCSKEVNPVVDTDQPVVEDNQPVSTVQKMIFTAYADNGDETRTSLSTDNKVNWAAGESIYVFDGKAPRRFVANEGGSVVTFSGEADQAGTYYAVSPAATMTGTTINATIPVFQTATAGTYDPKAAISVAVSNTNPNGTNELKFKNAAALVKFQISDENVTKIRLDAINGKKLAGKATITLESDNTPTLQMVDSQAESCVILQPASGAFNTGTDYVIAIAPGTYAGGFKLTLIKSDNKYASFSNTSSQTLDRSSIMNFGTLPAVKTWKETLQEFTDEITRSLTGITGTSYDLWEDKQCSNAAHSSVVYAGYSAGGNSSIQLRSDKNESGIITTTSGGKAKSVTVVWNDNTQNGRELDVYGKNTAYSSWSGASDLYDNNAGDFLGSIVKGTSTSLTITGDYKFIGLRSKSGAMYLSKISIVWEAAGEIPFEEPTVDPPVFQIQNQTPADGNLAADGGEASFVIHSTIPWTIDAENEASIPYTSSTEGDYTTVTATFGSISEGSRSLTFTVTSSEGAVKTVSFTQSYSKTYTQLFVITSDAVVSNSGYSMYTATVDNRGWVITYGGNNVSVGTNSNKRSNCNLSSYSKYAVSPVTTSSTASAFANTTKVDNVAKIKYVVGGGKNQSYTKVYLLYSSDNTSFSQVALTSTSPTQGGDIVTSSSGAEFEFEKRSGYFAVLFVATNTSGDWRLDDVNLTFYTY